MSQIATFFVPTVLPNAAGAGARAETASQGGDFAGILAQFQAALQEGGVPPAANTAVQVGALQNPQLIAQLSAALAQTGDGLSTGNLAAQLQALAESGATVPPQLQALLDALTSGEQQGAAGKGGNAEQSAGDPLAALLALIQQPADATSQSVAGAAGDIGLRGTLAPDASKAAAAQTAAGENPQAAPDDQTIPPALLPLLSARPQSKDTVKTAVAEQPVQADAKDGVAPRDASNQLQPSIKGDRPAETPGFAAQLAAAHARGDSKSGNQTAQPNAGTPSPQAVVAAPVPANPPVNTAQQVSVTVSNMPQAAVPLDSLAVHIARKFDAGSSQFEIRLHPAELGKLDITLHVADDGRVQAVLRAERAETLDMLQRDARVLEQQLRQAGLDVGSNSLNFSLSGGNNGQRHMPFSGWPGFADADDDAAATAQQAASTYLAVPSRDGLDIRV